MAIFMRSRSWSTRRQRARPCRHCFCTGTPSGAAETGDRPSRFNVQLETAMTWETPAAIDFRFGFEITMYVAAR
jgi:coenzyme PQQ precursor peptide PqqA